jgi:4-amino-4-deoxy-L-arabinose transferase-like glycosyltransferase
MTMHETLDGGLGGRPDERSPLTARDDRRFRIGVLVAVVVGALWRLGILVVDKWDQQLLFNDSLYYSAQARQLADGVFFREIFVDRPGAEHGPLTSILLAPVSWMDNPVPWQRLVTIACGVVTIAVLGILGRRLGDWRTGVAAASIAAVYPNLWMNDGLVMSESVSVLTVSLTLLVAHDLLTGERMPRLLAVGLLGVLAGLATLARSELGLLIPALVVLLAIRTRTWRPAVVLVFGAVLVVGPWVGFNLTRFERPVLLTTNDGTTLLGAYCDASFYGVHLGSWSLPCQLEDPDYSMDEEPSIRSERQRALAVEYARANVRALPKVVAARVGRTLDLYGFDGLVGMDVGEERYRWASWAGIVCWWVLAPLAIVGAVVSRRRMSPYIRWLLFVPVIAVAITTVVFYGAHRIRSSMEPTVVLFAAIAVVAAIDAIRRRGVVRR